MLLIAIESQCKYAHNLNFTGIPSHGAKNVFALIMISNVVISAPTPFRRIRWKARVDLGDQTAEFIPFEVMRTAILTYFYLLLGTNVRILVSVINTRFRPDAPRRCSSNRFYITAPLDSN